jgi:hypothetical protein
MSLNAIFPKYYSPKSVTIPNSGKLSTTATPHIQQEPTVWGLGWREGLSMLLFAQESLY